MSKYKYPEIRYEDLNQETKDAMEEAHRIIHDPNVKHFKTFRELWDDLLSEDEDEDNNS